MTKVTVTYPQPISVKVDTGKDRVVQSTATFVGSANNFLSTVGGNISGNITIQGTTFTGNIIPSADKVYNIGTPTLRFKTLYLAGNTIDLGGGTISADGNTVTLTSPQGGTLFFDAPANTTIDAAAGERAEQTANLAYDSANTSTLYSTGAFYYSTEAVSTATEATNVATAAYETTNSVYDQTNTATLYAATSFYYSADALATSEVAANTANVASNTATGAYEQANTSLLYAATAYYYSGEAYTQSNSAIETANIAAQTVNEFLANSNTIIRVTGGTLNGPLLFQGNVDANLAIGNIESNDAIDIYSSNVGSSRLNYSNINYIYANSFGVQLETQNNNISLNNSEDSIQISSKNLFAVTVNGTEAMAVYANNEIYFNGNIFGLPPPENLDGGDF
jgi:hypothetical protein